MWIRINHERLKDSSIKEYKGRGKSQSSGEYCIELKYNQTIKYFKYSEQSEYETALNRLDDILKVQEV